MLYTVKITSYLGAYKLWKTFHCQDSSLVMFYKLYNDVQCTQIIYPNWASLHDNKYYFRSSGSGILRTSGEAAKQYSNLKQRAKGKLSEAKRPKTGGGHKPPSPTPVELSILEQLEGRPSLEGICGGIDTADPVETQPSTSSSASSDVPAKKKDVQDSGKKKRKLTILELEERNISLENDKLQEEIEKLKDERQLIVAKKSYYDLKFQILCNNNPEVVAQMLKSNECWKFLHRNLR